MILPPVYQSATHVQEARATTMVVRFEFQGWSTVVVIVVLLIVVTIVVLLIVVVIVVAMMAVLAVMGNRSVHGTMIRCVSKPTG